MAWSCSEDATQRSAAFYHEQAAACRAIAHLQIHPTHRATFLRLALHWRAVAQSVDDVAARPKSTKIRSA